MTTETLLLLTWLSPAFPTGGYAYSHGIEHAVEAGDVSDETTASDWILDVIRDGAGRTDAILLRHAHRARGGAALAEVAALAAAAQPSAERRLETLSQGEAFSRAAQVWGGSEDQAFAYPVALGAAAARCGVSEDVATLGLLHAFAANLVSACVRLVPLGQTAGLRIQATLAPTLLAVAAQTAGESLDDVGSACFRSDIASMRHETQRTRLFRT
jgi:urease accessory protein